MSQSLSSSIDSIWGTGYEAGSQFPPSPASFGIDSVWGGSGYEPDGSEDSRCSSTSHDASLPEVCLSPEGESRTKTEAVGDELDGPMFKLFLDTMKSLVSRVLYIAIHDFKEYICNGCQISHPSQMQHTCLFGLPNFFLHTHYDGLKKRVVTSRFILAALKLLANYNIDISEEKVREVCEAILLELKPSEKVLDTIGDIQDELVGDSESKIENPQKAVNFWEGKEDLDTTILMTP